VEDVVAQIVEDFAVELVGAGLRRDIHDRSRITSVFGAECRIRDLELVDSIYRWLKCDLLVCNIVQVDAVQHEVHAIFTVAGGVETEETLTAQRRAQSCVRGRSDRSGDEHPEIEKVSAVERNLLDRSLIDHLSNGDRRRFDGGSIAG